MTARHTPPHQSREPDHADDIDGSGDDGTASGERRAQVQRVLDDADARDEQADVRDSVAADRDGVADRESFLDPDSDYDASLRARRSAAMDRSDSKDDRASAAEDRSELTPDHDPPTDRDGSSNGV
ncbi:hypothetical protein [Pedococcus bigeumensis]|uniref:Uncharacterized protein n=1 Tax=Pedococcus bigeumensis TaxID=433644 RepID=A0A502CT90_9MICO|nr:hypothetical protein [Pedococcus bigeumensis]TPG14951.1 hypothetical protein EAH86_15545 [Pedococcus bigeumensis]